MLDTGAQFSPCRTWRYSLWRRWSRRGPTAAFIGLNPSTADETRDDPTVRRCIRFAQSWGYGRMFMLNIFAYRSTDPRALRHVADPIGPGTNAAIVTICRRARLVVACWGQWGRLLERGGAVAQLLRDSSLHCLDITRDGHPKHPLYISAATKPRRFPYVSISRLTASSAMSNSPHA
jgi:hypothetical protein